MMVEDDERDGSAIHTVVRPASIRKRWKIRIDYYNWIILYANRPRFATLVNKSRLVDWQPGQRGQSVVGWPANNNKPEVAHRNPDVRAEKLSLNLISIQFR